MTAWGYLAIGVLLAVLGLVPRLVADLHESRRRRRAFEGVAVVPAASASRGGDRVQIVGTLVVASGSVRAPIRARDAGWVRLTVGAGRGFPANADGSPEEAWAELSISDSSGEVPLATDGARVELDADRHVPREFTTNLVGPPPSELGAWMERRGLLSAPANVHVTVSEWVLDHGDPVAVVGTVRQGDGPYRGKSVLQLERLRLLAGSKY